MPLIEYHRRKNRLRPKATLNSEASKAAKSLVVTLSVIILFLAIVSLAMSSKGNQKGYSLEQEKLKNEELRDLNENLSTKITTSTTFNKMEETNKVTTMEEIAEKTYVTEKDNLVN